MGSRPAKTAKSGNSKTKTSRYIKTAAASGTAHYLGITPKVSIAKIDVRLQKLQIRKK